MKIVIIVKIHTSDVGFPKLLKEVTVRGPLLAGATKNVENH